MSAVLTQELPAMAAGRAYRQRHVRRVMLVGALLCALAVSLAVDIATGPSGMGMSRLFQVLLQPDGVLRMEQVIVWDVRLPYALMAVLVGAALAIVLNWSVPGVPPQYVVSANAFLFAFASVGLLHLLTRWRGFGVESLVLFGIALVFAFNALVALLQFVASQDSLQQLVFWTMGSLSRSSWDKIAILAAALAVIAPWAVRDSWAMTALTMGEDRARSFGVDVRRLRMLSLLRISLLSALAVSFVGTIGFIGLVAPHIARLLVGEDHRLLLPASALAGALILSLASICSKTLIDGVLIPVGIVTALVGIPFFMAIVMRQRGGAA